MTDPVKPLRFRGTSLEDLRVFPALVRREAGYQLDKVQMGREPSDWKPMTAIGLGAQEIRIRDKNGAFRVIYVAKFEQAITFCTASKRNRRLRAKRT